MTAWRPPQFVVFRKRLPDSPAFGTFQNQLPVQRRTERGAGPHNFMTCNRSYLFASEFDDGAHVSTRQYGRMNWDLMSAIGLDPTG
ncbi:hypothetical protein [uncultured Sulfitobacter sp.]|uniref:hypothetical protein n=1 Tax=uncultured Sulfitobacter sp. TaxID=191468 RepID=UPI002601D9FD|nr:hypothetical protein [uncultured Sulfitobacter sp.]